MNSLNVSDFVQLSSCIKEDIKQIGELASEHNLILEPEVKELIELVAEHWKYKLSLRSEREKQKE